MGAAKKAWETRKKKYGKSGIGRKQSNSPAQKAVETKSRGRSIKVRSPSVKRNGEAKGTYAPPKKWWDYMTKEPHGAARKPLTPAAAGHLWFKVYDDKKRLETVKKYG